jgi:DNA-binding transcriptional LysR family regulator
MEFRIERDNFVKGLFRSQSVVEKKGTMPILLNVFIETKEDGISITATDLKSEHFLLYQRNSITFRIAEDFFLRNGVGLTSYVEIPSFEIMKQLAKLGLGIAFMAPWVAEKELAEGSLVMRSTPRSKLTRQWAVIHQGKRELRKPEQTFIGLCRMATAQLGRRFGEPGQQASF